MPAPLLCVPPSAVIAGWDFSTGAVKALAFDLAGAVVAEVRLPTDLWTADGVSELSLLQLEGQARASVRGLAARGVRGLLVCSGSTEERALSEQADVVVDGPAGVADWLSALADRLGA